MSSSLEAQRWLQAPVAFIREVLVNPETNRPFELYPAQERFLREALTLKPDGTLPYPELLFSAPKKSGKTATTAFALIYVVAVLGGPYAEGICAANDLEQAQGRVFQAAARMVERSPLLRAKVRQNRIEFSNGATITAIGADYAGAAGSNPTIASFDELWGYTSESSRRLWDEMVPSPTRKVSVRWTSTYAGFEGESELLEELYKRTLKGEQIAPALYRQPGLLAFWSHQPVAPWQTEAWLEQMREQLRPNAYLRMIENRFVSGETSFVPIEWWDAASTGRPVLGDRGMPVWLGVDAATKRDAAAVVACTFTEGKVQVVGHRIFTPGREELSLEQTVEHAIRDFASRFYVREVRYDPYQMARSAQTLQGSGIPMVEFAQTQPNLTAATANLYELLKGGNLAAYPDAEVRLAVQRSVAVETPRGLKISKDKASHHIDVVVALGMAALGAVQGGVDNQRLMGFVGATAFYADGTESAYDPDDYDDDDE